MTTLSPPEALLADGAERAAASTVAARVLVVESERAVALDLQRSLHALGVEVTAMCANGEDALCCAREIVPDLALVDIHLRGEMDGFETARRLRVELNVPVLFLTAHRDADTVERAKGTEHFGFLWKPLDNRELQISLEMVLHRARAERELRESEARFRALFEAAADAVLLYEIKGCIHDANACACESLGYTREELLRLNVSDISELHDAEMYFRDLKPQLQNGVPITLNGIHKRKNGTTFPVEVRVRRFQSDGEPLFLALARDMSERECAKAELQVSENRFRTVVQCLGEGLMMTDRDGVVEYVNARMCELSGYAPEEMLGARAYDLMLPPDERAAMVERNQRRLSGTSESYEIRLRRKDGTIFWAGISATPYLDASGQIVGALGAITDITHRKEAERRLEHAAFYDQLTDLPNRALFTKRLSETLARAHSHNDNHNDVADGDGHGDGFAVLFLDLDRFKTVNDSLGHLTGDKLLIAAARRLESCLREGDTIARLGGDEFTILLDPLPDPNEATRLAERVQDALAQPFHLDEYEIYTGTSIGITLGAPHYTRPDELLRDADTAMYRAKARGKGCHELFDGAMHARALARLQVESALRHAIEKEELELHFQPIVSLQNGQLQGFEALCRWCHDGAMVPPNEFIPVAEDTGLILPLGRWVLTEACRQMSAWLHESHESNTAPGTLTMSVNLSSKQFSGANLPDEVANALRAVNLHARHLKLEITESVLMENEGGAAQLASIKNLGVALSIDDFGTGYSSLASLHRFPLNTLKIDRAFVSRLDATDDESTAIARAIIALAHSLRMNLVAEGIETLQQHDILRDFGCEGGQGYLFSRPLPAQSAGEFFARYANGARVQNA